MSSHDLNVVRFRVYLVQIRERQAVRILSTFANGRIGVVLADGTVGYVSEFGIQDGSFVRWLTEWTDIPPPVDIWANIGCGG